MSIIDATQINLAANLSSAAAPATTPAVNASGDGGNGAAKPVDTGRPESSDLINSILDKHGLSSPEELAEFVDSIAELQGQIGDNDPEELLKAKNTLDAYQREWTKKEQERLKEAETPEQTIARLEREAADRDNKAAQRDKQKRNAESAKRAVKSYSDVIAATVKGEKTVPAEYVPFVQEFLGVGSPVNEVNINDRAAVKKMAKEYGIKRVLEFEQAVIKRYREGKTEIPVPPPASGESAPVTDDNKPKNLKESRAMAHTMISKLWGK